jgi:uncharacterized protein YehS (DUF1456 family)
MKRSEINPLPEYFDRYILKCDDADMIEVLKTAIKEVENLPITAYQKLGNMVYAPGKWTMNEVFQHMIDTNYIFTYRALAYSRGETEKVPSFDEETYAKNSEANRRDLYDLQFELKHSYESLLLLFQSFTPGMLSLPCIGFKGTYSVGSVAFCMAGHLRWHVGIIEERYLPLL